MSKVDELRWVRVFTPVHIPKYLVEQIKKRDYTVEDFYKYQEAICLRMENGTPYLNPYSHLYVLVNPENLTKGFLWFTVDPLAKDLVIQTYTVDKEYWGAGGSIKKLADHIKDIRRKAKLNKIYWITDYPKHSQRHGFRMSKSVLMEYSEEQDGKNIDGRSDARGEHRPTDTRTETVSGEHPGGSDGECSTSVPAVPPAVLARTISKPIPEVIRRSSAANAAKANHTRA